MPLCGSRHPGVLEDDRAQDLSIRGGRVGGGRHFQVPECLRKAAALEIRDGKLEVELVGALTARTFEIARDPGIDGGDGAIPLHERSGHPIDRCLDPGTSIRGRIG